MRAKILVAAGLLLTMSPLGAAGHAAGGPVAADYSGWIVLEGALDGVAAVRLLGAPGPEQPWPADNLDACLTDGLNVPACEGMLSPVTTHADYFRVMMPAGVYTGLLSTGGYTRTTLDYGLRGQLHWLCSVSSVTTIVVVYGFPAPYCYFTGEVEGGLQGPWVLRGFQSVGVLGPVVHTVA